MSTPDVDHCTDLVAARRVLGILVVLTFLALLLTAPAVTDLASAKALSAAAAVLAFVKARYVALDFMDLRATVLQRVLDGWLGVVGLACVALLLR